MAETMSQLLRILNSWELLADTGKTTMMHRVPTTTTLVPEAFFVSMPGVLTQSRFLDRSWPWA